MLLRLNFLITLSGFFGSLYFSEILKYPPCTLCWYQRICLYPLMVIFGTALWTEEPREDSTHKRYALPLALIGLGLGVYHNLLYYGIISEALTPCTQGVSCSSRQLELWGFITIPLMSLLSFATITALLIFTKKQKRNYE